jgi:hypothetical protein
MLPNIYPIKSPFGLLNLKPFFIISFLFFSHVAKGESHAASDTTAQKRSNPFATYFKPAKLDLITVFQEKSTAANFMFWSQSLKAGFGTLYSGQSTGVAHYGGGWFRPLAFTKYPGDLIVAANYSMPTPSNAFWDVQSEFRLPFGFCFGGGANQLAAPKESINYWGKISYRKTIKDWSLIITYQNTPLTNGSKNLADHIRPGAYAAVYNPIFMAAGGYAYAQFRSCIGLMSPKQDAKYRPVFEALYIDNNAGGYSGLRYVFANFTLGIEGGFLTNAARLGRAMGPTGLEFGNPLGYLSNPVTISNWNRKLNSWEMGRMLNFRLENFEVAAKNYNGYAQCVINPFQFDNRQNLLDPIYIGGEYVYTHKVTTAPLTNQGGFLLGYYYKISAFSATAGIEYVVNNTQPIVTIGVIYRP